MALGDTSDLDKMLDEMQSSIIEDARETFSEEVVNRWLNPRNMGRMESPDGAGRITGPCGDTMEIFLKIKEDRIINTMFMTDGCGTSIAAGSMTADLATGKDTGLAMQTGEALKHLDRLCRKGVVTIVTTPDGRFYEAI
ncbi:MAG: iron-sulfur cluster assembly scaffold protein [Deltaproteobacteria bacterium]|nr:iron-sulfur cluster assembly scaffold protein [Deltaproteobacteria bacterium]